MLEALTLKEPFPTTDGICPDAYSLAVICPAYSTPCGELNAILQYMYHYFNFKSSGLSAYASTLESIAVAEMFHFKILGNVITALGAPPIYCQFPSTAYNFYSTKYVAYSRNLKQMIEDDILGERRAINMYGKMLKRLRCDNLIQIVSRIRDDEKLHLETLEKILCELNC